MAVDPWDTHPLALEIKEYFTEENSEQTIVGIWEDVYYGIIDCCIGGEKVFDCLNIVRGLYVFFNTKRLSAHKIPEFWEQLGASKFSRQRETIFSALYYLLVKTGNSQRLCEQVCKYVDYDNGYGWRPFDVWENLLAKNDSVSNESILTYEEGLQEYYNSPEGREEMEEYLENFPTEEDFERWEREEREREEREREEQLEMSNYFTSEMTADDWALLQSAWQSDENGAGLTVQYMQQLYSQGKVKKDIKQKPFYDMMNRRFGTKFTKQNFNAAIRLHDVNNVFKLKNK